MKGKTKRKFTSDRSGGPVQTETGPPERSFLKFLKRRTHWLLLANGMSCIQTKSATGRNSSWTQPRHFLKRLIRWLLLLQTPMWLYFMNRLGDYRWSRTFCPAPLSRYQFKIETWVIINKLLRGQISQWWMWSIKIIVVPPSIQIILHFLHSCEIFEI